MGTMEVPAAGSGRTSRLHVRYPALDELHTLRVLLPLFVAVVRSVFLKLNLVSTRATRGRACHFEGGRSRDGGSARVHFTDG